MQTVLVITRDADEAIPLGGIIPFMHPAPARSCAKIIPAGPAQVLRAAILRRQSGSTALRYRLFDILLEYPAGSRVRDRIWVGSRPARVRRRCPPTRR